MIKAVLSASLLVCSALVSTQLFAGTEQCLDWEIKTHPTGDNLSSCAYYNRDKASTRFTVSNHCNTPVRGVFSYYSNDASSARVMSVQPFSVDPGRTTEVANPCDMASDWSYNVTQDVGRPLAQR